MGAKIKSRAIVLLIPTMVGSIKAAAQSPLPANCPFDATQATIHQKAWADHRGVPVESTNSMGITFRLIPAGEFMMGSPSDETGRHDDEVQHKVRITRAYYLAVTEVTQGQWKMVMGASPWSRRPFPKDGESLPATHVNWDDAMEFCKRLSEKEGKRYRLPSEAEWEYACRSGSTSAYCFAANPDQLREHAWFIENADPHFSLRSVRPVGSLKPNSFGLYDMYGNTGEWCSDWYGEYGDSAVTDPMGPLSGSQRVVRSSPILSEAARCRSAARNATSPNVNRPIGVRLAMDPHVE